MQAGKMGGRQLLLIAGMGLIIAQLILSYLGLGGRSLIKSFFWVVKNRYKLSLYLCIISVLVCRQLYGQVTDQNWYTPFFYPVLLALVTLYAWFGRAGFALKKSDIPASVMASYGVSLIQTGNTVQRK